jgi:signal transduction histidine kinase
MLHEFLHANSTELIERCRVKVARRRIPRATAAEMEHGIPLFLNQLIETLRQAQAGGVTPDAAGGRIRRDMHSEIGLTASRHGHELLQHGFTLNQVVHDYGDLCQAVTELAGESGSPVSMDEFRILNSCLDHAIADAVTEFDRQRDEDGSLATSERLGSLAHEMRNFLNTAMLGFAAIKTGRVAAQGATSAIVDRSLDGLRDLVDRALAEVRLVAGIPPQLEDFPLGRFIEQVEVAASLEAEARGCGFTAHCEPADLAVRADRQMLLSALSNVLQNAFKFTRHGGHVHLHAYGSGDRAHIEVQDECGGLPAGGVEDMFRPFEQKGSDRSGLGLGLGIARRAVEACGGSIRVRDMPSVGCVFTIELVRRVLRPRVLEPASA